MKRGNFIHNIMIDMKHHPVEYGALLIAGTTFLLTMHILKGHTFSMVIAAGIFTIFYVVWGIIHHKKDQTLHLKIVLEYVGVGAIAFFVLLSLLIL